MFFQFSPVKKAPTKPIEQKNDSEEVAVLSLAPFSAKPKIFFDVKCGVNSFRQLIIKNPTNQDINLNLRNNFPEELVVTFNWEKCVIEKLSEALLEIQWCPSFEFASRLTLTIEDGKKVKADIPIVFKSNFPKKKTGTKPKTSLASKKAKSPMKKVISTKVKSPQKKGSPRQRPPLMANSSRTRTPPQTQRNIPSIAITTPPNRRETFCVKGKENRYTSPKHENRHVSSNKNPYLLASQNDDRRQTFTIKDVIKKQPKSPVEMFNDSLESISPDPPTHKFRNRRVLSPLVENNHSTNFAYKLDSISFKFSPTTTPNKSNITMSNPVYNFADKINRLDLCSSENITFDFQSPNSTRIEDKVRNIMLSPCESIIPKLNSSTSTCIKGNTSFETYVKGNVSSGTYVKDTSIGNIAALSEFHIDQNCTKNSHYAHHDVYNTSHNLSLSNASRLRSLQGEGCKGVIEANMWSEHKSKPMENYGDINLRRQRQNTLNDFKLPQNPNKVPLKRKIDDPVSCYAFSPPKKALLERRARMSLNWSKSSGVAMKIAKSFSTLSLNKTDNGKHTLTSKETKTCIVTNPFLLAATNMIDPFMTSQVYSDEDWIDKQIKHFMKWLNALLTPPAELETKSDVKVDVAKVWQDIKNRDVAKAPTKESLSNKYHTSAKLDSLRKNAQKLYRSAEIAAVLSKLVISIEAGKINIRTDKEFYLDLSIKSELMSLILSYNTLWLRIGLETVYNEEIPLSSNSDITGLSSFLAERFFKDPKLIKKHKSLIDPKYKEPFKKVFLKRFFSLVYFLDQAKNKKIIAHDPCLFRKNAPVKESREILIRFTKETLSGVGDITKFLKYFGYFVTHKQTYINEFDYAVTNLGVDLRDGVRLTKVMEIILLKDGLTTLLRVPAISRLQKIHNVKIAFDSLQAEGFKILYDIEAKDIVDGHKEKSLSFLWQIIYKFEAPLMVKSSTTIQKWYRSLPVVLKRRKIERIRQTKIDAATKIQKWYRRQVLSEKIFFFAVMLHHHLDNLRKQRAATKIQAWYKMQVCHKDFLRKKLIIINIQRYSKGWLVRNIRRHEIAAAVKLQSLARGFVQRRKYQKLKHAARIIQIQFRAIKLMKEQSYMYKKLRTTVIGIQSRFKGKKERDQYLKLKNAAVVIQRRYRALIQMRKERSNYKKLKNAAIVLQTRFRARQLCISQRTSYSKLKSTTIFVQGLYRANRSMVIVRNEYTTLRNASIKIQTWYRSVLKMRKNRERYQMMRQAAIVIQTRYRAKQLCFLQKTYYNELKNKTIFIQRLYRANRSMVIVRNEYTTLRNASIKIQTWYRSILKMRKNKERYQTMRKAAIVIQTRFRAKQLCIVQKKSYNELKNKTIFIQRLYRANRSMELAKNEYTTLRNSSIKIQTWYRSILKMRENRKRYQTMRKAAIVIQNCYRAKQLCILQKTYYNELKNKTIFVQRLYRANRSMVIAKNEYTNLRNASIKIQTWYTSILKMRENKKRYQTMRKAAIVIQTRYRAKQSCILQKTSYNELKNKTIFIQRLYRANRSMVIARNEYTTLRSASVKIQTWYRSILCMRKCRKDYLTLKKAVRTVEEMYIAKKKMERQHNLFKTTVKAIITIQQKFRAMLKMNICKQQYQNMKVAANTLQTRFRANKLAKIQRINYLELQKATLVLQHRYKANCSMKIKRKEYLEQRSAAIKIQSWYRSILSMRKCRKEFLTLKKAVKTVEERYIAKKKMENQFQIFRTTVKAVLTIQQKFKATQHMRVCKKEYQNKKIAASTLQARFRANKLAKIERNTYLQLQKATTLLQQHYRANCLMKIHRREYLTQKTAIIQIQTWYRSILEMRKCKIRYQALKKAVRTVEERYIAKKKKEALIKAAIVIQTYYRAKKAMETDRNSYLLLKQHVTNVQIKYRAILQMRIQRKMFVTLKKSCIIVQQRFRTKIAMVSARTEYQKTRNAAICIQKQYRAQIAMRVARNDFVALKNSCIQIQRKYRAQKQMIKERKSYLELKKCVIIVQQRFRANQLMKEELKRYQIVQKAVLLLQTKFRATALMKEQRIRFNRIRAAVLIIQNFYVGYKRMKSEREIFLLKRLSCIKIQTCMRGFLVRKEYGKYFTEEAKEERRVLRAQNKAATKIQATWRGYKQRSIEKIPQMAKIRKRVKNANDNASNKNTLAQRCEHAVYLILNHNSLLQIIKALEDIEFVTRRDKVTCLKMSSVLPDQLYIMINYTARSLPEMTACTLASLILINFYKYEPTTKQSFLGDYMDQMITVMLNWCDKEAPLFPTICTLLWLFAHKQEYKEVILNVPHLDQRLLKIQTLTYRKEKMVEKTGVKGSSLFTHPTNLPLPSTTPDWGLEYTHRPNIFKNSVHALKSLQSILHMNTNA